MGHKEGMEEKGYEIWERYNYRLLGRNKIEGWEDGDCLDIKALQIIN